MASQHGDQSHDQPASTGNDAGSLESGRQDETDDSWRQEIFSVVEQARSIEQQDLHEGSSAEQGTGELEVILRPNGSPYYPRRLTDVSDVDLLAKLRRAGEYLLLDGPPGTGKTALVEAAFANGDERSVITVNCHGDLEDADLVGRYVVDPDGYRWTDGPLPQAMRAGRVLFLDDVALAPPSVVARVYPAMDGRDRIVLTEHGNEEVVSADGFYVVAAWNPGIVGSRLSEALSSRFAVHMHVATDIAMLERLGLDSDVARFALRLAALRRKGVLSWSPEARELFAYMRLRTSIGRAAALTNMLGLAPAEDRELIAQEATSFISESAYMQVGLSLDDVAGRHIER